MKTIWKFQFEIDDLINIEMPEGTEILCIQTQLGLPCIWAIVDTKAKSLKTRKFQLFGTGHDMQRLNSESKYIGTFQMRDGYLVFHLFEVL